MRLDKAFESWGRSLQRLDECAKVLEEVRSQLETGDHTVDPAALDDAESDFQCASAEAMGQSQALQEAEGLAELGLEAGSFFLESWVACLVDANVTGLAASGVRERTVDTSPQRYSMPRVSVSAGLDMEDPNALSGPLSGTVEFCRTDSPEPLYKVCDVVELASLLGRRLGATAHIETIDGMLKDGESRGVVITLSYPPEQGL